MPASLLLPLWPSTFYLLPSTFSPSARVLLLLAAGVLAACSDRLPNRPLPESAAIHLAPTFANVPYARAGGHDLLLDLYLPGKAGSGRGRPVLIFLHGGGWRLGNKSTEVERVTELVGQTGYALASVNYRLSNEGRFPTQLLDCKAAVRWLRANAGRYGLDPRRIGVIGFSAGGHLASLLGTTGGVAKLEDPGEGSPGQSSRVQAVVDVSGPVDLNIPTSSLIGKLAVLGELGSPASSKPDLVREANPSLYVHAGDPPFLIIQGDNDGLVTPAHAQQLYASLRAKEVPATLLVVTRGGHVPFGPDQERATREFLVRQFGPP